jgi:hypothetical protein
VGESDLLDGGGHTLIEASTNFNNSSTGFGLFPDDHNCSGIMAGVHGNVGYSINCYGQPSSGVWHHLAVVYDKSQAGSNEVTFYIDGVLQTPTLNWYTATNTNAFGNNPLYLFSRGGSQDFAGGLLDDLRIYNRALSASEIQQLYNFGTGGAVLVSLAVTPVNSSIAKGTTQQFTATGTFSDGSTQNLTNTVTWTSTNAAVATITSSGLATGVAPGSTMMQAAWGSVSSSTSLTVTAPVSGLVINYRSGFTSSTGLWLNGGAVLNGARLRLTDGGSNEAHSAFFTIPVNV